MLKNCNKRNDAMSEDRDRISGENDGRFSLDRDGRIGSKVAPGRQMH